MSDAARKDTPEQAPGSWLMPFSVQFVLFASPSSEKLLSQLSAIFVYIGALSQLLEFVLYSSQLVCDDNSAVTAGADPLCIPF